MGTPICNQSIASFRTAALRFSNAYKQIFKKNTLDYEAKKWYKEKLMLKS